MDIATETERIEQFVAAGNYHAAINIGLSCLNACRREADQAGVDHCLAIIQSIVDRLAGEFGSGA